MNLELSDEALEFGRLARRALEPAGGDAPIREIGGHPDGRSETVAAVLAELGAWQLEPRRRADDLEAAAALCRSAGYWAVGHPVAERLCRPDDLDVDGLLVVTGPEPAAAVAGLDLRWAAVSLDGRRSRAVARPPGRARLHPAPVVPLDLEPLDGDGHADAALGLVLPCWTLLGLFDRALDLTRAHVLDRHQFGGPLAGFQGVQFQLTDAEVERVGVEELAKYALWSVQVGREEALDDALALRLAAVEAADTVFGVAHQLHGAIGFCDETPLSWVSRRSVPLRRLPLGGSGTRTELARRLGRRGLSGLFGGPVPR